MTGGSKGGRAKESRPAEDWALIEPFLSARGIRLEARQRRQVVGFVELLLHWNRRINLVGDSERIFSRHVLDCLV
ncbi:MAG: class I SAM-dependent methyltransferase, partial [SAR324 cluster bacterium]|nr:class I SAM-dependent methyltransferase [SAR324 cluster bacterium]